MKAWTLLPLCILTLGLIPSPGTAVTWDVSDATVTLVLDERHLHNVGLEVADARETSREEVFTGLEGTAYAFATPALTGLVFDESAGEFLVRGDGTATLPVKGGLALRTHHPRSGRALEPVFLYDFTVEIDGSRRDPLVLRGADGVERVLVRNAGLRLDRSGGVLWYAMGDLQISRAWARELGQPELEGQWIGGFDLRIRAEPSGPREETRPDPDVARGSGQGAVLDVTLGELYGLTSQGHIGTYPNGTAGLSAATTSCNTGSVIVPWNSPMAETHPFIGLALFREHDGVLEMIGRNWMKHGFLALSNDQCDLGCSPSDGTYLGIGCSDTYSAGNNGSRYYLGPRSEVHPFTGEWNACGSYFDEPSTPDADCSRDYFGAAPDNVAHRLEVADADLDWPGATYYYEGEYVVAGDAKPENNIGWRECTMSWSGSNWSFSTVGGGVTPNYGPLINSWGDVSKSTQLGADDGEMTLSVQVTDLGGGQYHYEYALYNWRSARSVHSISIPVGAFNVSNVGFHDPDQDAGNDWTAVVADGMITWSTDDWATDPNASVIEHQEMFNFRFDCDSPGVLSEGTITAFRPGMGTSFVVGTKAPALGPVTGVALTSATEDGIRLFANEPNPFANGTRLSFSLPSPQTVRLSVHDVSGRTVQVLHEGRAPAGATRVSWNGRDAQGTAVASGVYFFRLTTEEGTRSVKGTVQR